MENTSWNSLSYYVHTGSQSKQKIARQVTNNKQGAPWKSESWWNPWDRGGSLNRETFASETHLAGPKFEQSYIFIHLLSPQIFRLLRLTFWWILALCIQWVRHEVSSCLLLWWKWSGEFVGVGLAVEWKGSLQFHGFKWIFILMLVALVLFAWNIIPLGCCVIKISQGAKTTIMDCHYTNNYISIWR